MGIGLDAKGFKKGLDDLYQSIKLSKQQFKTATAQMGDFGKTSDKLKLKAQTLSKQITAQKAIVSKLNEAFQKSKAIKGDDAAETKALQMKLLKAQEAQGKLENELRATNRKLKNQSKFSSNLKDKMSSLTKSVGSAAAKFGSFAIKAGAAAAVGIGAAMGKAAKESITHFAEFETGMNEVFTLLPGISQTAMDDMESQVKGFSNAFGRLPTEVIPALYQSLSAGVPRDNVFEFMTVAQKAAKGGVTELETAVDGISSVVNAYGAEILSATQASDLMFTAVRLGKTSFGEMSASLSDVTPIASNVGVKFAKLMNKLEELRTALGDKPIRILSGYRSSEYNAKLYAKSQKSGGGGVAKNSAHMRCTAADIHVKEKMIQEVYDAADKIFKEGGVGIYKSSGFVHVDVDNANTRPARWGQ